MKKLKATIFVTLCMSLFLLNSCQSNSSDDNGAEASTGDYWPTAVGNQWVMNQNGSEVAMKIISTESIKGDTYFKFNQFVGITNEISGTGLISIKKVKGDYYLKVDDLVYDYSGFTAKAKGFEYLLFKDYLDVNKTWTGSFIQETTVNIPNFPGMKMTVNYTGTILEKATTVTVNGTTYKDVIKFKFHQEAKMDTQPTTYLDAEYWIAKDVGVVKMTSGETTSTLKSYVVKK
ncbi:hypothetical protein [uncultured Flavobacterium sp.]|uniref:hypothetical protein n=1 Tax=uncultured Flavobacterium sp. TaxID=165435 RepID=UPI00292ED046|nr:hypothetical protein [uncultured Flavobacterium sp.]